MSEQRHNPIPDVRTGMVTELDHERYVVFKTSDATKYLSSHRQRILYEQLRCIADGRHAEGKVPNPRAVVIRERSPLFKEATATMLQLINEPLVKVQDRLIRTPSAVDLRLVAKTFLGSIVHINLDTSRYNGSELIIEKGGEFMPWNPWNDLEQALHLGNAVRMRIGYSDGPHIEYWDDAPLGGHGEVMLVASCKQHCEVGLSLSIARKMTQVAVYRAHRIQGTI